MTMVVVALAPVGAAVDVPAGSLEVMVAVGAAVSGDVVVVNPVDTQITVV